MKSQQFNFVQYAVLVNVIFVLALVFNTSVKAQALKDIQKPAKPLVLEAQGSLYVGGDTVTQTIEELGSFVPAGHIVVNQMYVRYMVPQHKKRNPVVLIHGMALTGKTWETTPDGRMGWDEYFARNGHSVFIPDQIFRGRSGFNQAVFNNVRSGKMQPNALPPIWRFSDENSWPNFRFGTAPGVPFKDGQFPVEALGELAKQGVLDVSMGLANPNPNYKALADLASQVNNAVLISHSQSGSFPLDAALIDSTSIAAMVLVEPGRCPTTYSERQVRTLATVPILVVFGDYLDTPTGVPGHSWQASYEGCNAFIQKLNAVGGNATMLHLPEKGIPGNSHMIMQDKNNLQVADLILKWIDENVSSQKTRVSKQKRKS